MNDTPPNTLASEIKAEAAQAGRELRSGCYHTAKLLGLAALCAAIGAGLIVAGLAYTVPAASGLGIGFAAITAAVITIMLTESDLILPTTGLEQSIEGGGEPVYRRVIRAIIAGLALAFAIIVAAFFFNAATPIAAAAVPPGALLAHTAYRLVNR